MVSRESGNRQGFPFNGSLLPRDPMTAVEAGFFASSATEGLQFSLPCDPDVAGDPTIHKENAFGFPEGRRSATAAAGEDDAGDVSLPNPNDTFDPGEGVSSDEGISP